MVRKNSQVQGSRQGSQRRNSSSTGINLNTPPLTPTITTTELSQGIGDLLVVCVFWGKKYDTSYVTKLKSMVERHLHAPHRFICLSDVDIDGVDCIPIFRDEWTGWWQKVCLFTPNLFPAGSRILYLDLDVIITGDITTLAKQWSAQPLTMIYNFGPNRAHCAHNSSVMMWHAGDPRVNPIHDYFTADVMKLLHGDQCWIWRVLREGISNWPQNLIKSYKYDCRTRVDPSARVVVFHGSPKPHEVRDNWAIANWV